MEQKKAEETHNVSHEVSKEKIFVVLDMEEKKIQALKNDRELVPFNKKNESSFLKLTNDSILENFGSNLIRQYENPKRFKVLEIPVDSLAGAYKSLEQLLQPNPPQEVIQLADEYTVKPKIKDTDLKSEGLNENTEKKYQYIDEAMVNWQEIEEKTGITRDYLARKGYLDNLLKGGKTPDVVPVKLNLGESCKFNGYARLSFRINKSGLPYLEARTPKTAPTFDLPYYGHHFSAEDKKNLLEKKVMGRSVFLNGTNGEKVKAIIGLDPVTNEIIATRVSKVFIPDEKCNVKLSDDEKERLREGKEVRVENMVDKHGKEFPGTLFISPDTHKVEIKFDSQDLFERKTLGGIKLTEEQLEKLKNNEVVKVENMKNSNGKPFDRFVRINTETQRPEFFKFNPDSPEDNREIIIPKFVSGKEIPAEDFERFAEGKPIWMEGMIKANGEEMDRFIELDTNTGEIRYGRTLEDLHMTLDEKMEQKFEVPKVLLGRKLKASELSALRNGNSVKIDGLQAFNGTKITKWVKADMKSGTLKYYDENPDIPKEKNTLGNTPKKEQNKGQHVA